jgi:plastocyanin
MFDRKNAVLVIASLAVIAGLARSVRADDEKGSAVIKGQILLEGEPPKLKAVKMKDDAFCLKAKAKPVPGLRVWKDGTVPYVFVYIKKGIQGRYTPPSDPAKLNQKECMYRPHVFGMVAGQTLKITNSDPTSHNVHALPKKNTEFNFIQPSQGMTKDLTGRDTFTKPEVMIRFKCDVHGWMEAYCGVLPHPFFDVTGKPGTFEIKELPAGEYEVEAWHERFGKVTTTVKVGDGETKEIELKLPGSKKTASAGLITRTIMLGSLVDGGGALAESCCGPGAGGAGE